MSKEAATWSARPTKVEVRECELDGVRVLHFPDDSGRAEATLIFGVGARDETLPTLGTLHALEHAVMTGVRRTPIEIDASVRVSTTQFTAAGSPHLVGSFLTGVCRGLADPPLDRLAHEAHILAAELEGDDSATSPDRIEPEPTTNDPLPAGEAFRPPLLALALAKARASRVALTATGLAHTYQGRLQQIAWPEVVGVMCDDDGDVVVFAQHGQVIPVGPTLYKNGQRLVDAVLTHVAGHLVYESPAESDVDDHKETHGNSV